MEHLNSKKKELLDKESFGPLLPYILDAENTDVDFNGRDLWLTYTDSTKRKMDSVKVTQEFVEDFSNKVSMLTGDSFNNGNSVLEAETEDLRITILHEDRTNTGRAFCIRKAPAKPRYGEQDLLEQEFCNEKTLSLLINCVITKMNFVICGEPNTGKTELGKFLSNYIRPQDKVITIEDNPEWHYSKLHPDRDCIEIKVQKDIVSPENASDNRKLLDYTTAIKTCLRLNPSWIMLSEARSVEAKSLLECWSTGIKGITTIHTDMVQKIPDRFMNMIQNPLDADRIKNDIYDFVDVGILLRIKEFPDGKCRRYIDQICFFDRENETNNKYLWLDEGIMTGTEIPLSVKRRMERAGITDPYTYFKKVKNEN